jgi:hypothetical protein
MARRKYFRGLMLPSFAMVFIAIKLHKGIGKHKTNPEGVSTNHHFPAGTGRSRQGENIQCRSFPCYYIGKNFK